MAGRCCHRRAGSAAPAAHSWKFSNEKIPAAAIGIHHGENGKDYSVLLFGQRFNLGGNPIEMNEVVDRI